MSAETPVSSIPRTVASRMAVTQRILIWLIVPLLAPGLGLILIFKKPIRAIYLLITLLPLHVLIMTLLIGVAGLPLGLVRVVAAWKEALIIGILLLLLARLAIGQRVPFRVTLLDLFALLLLAQTIVYLLLPGELFDNPVGLRGQLYGVRDIAFLTVIYFVGRLTPAGESEARTILRLLFWVGVITSIIGLAERFLIPISLYAEIGLDRYHHEFLGVVYQIDYFNPWGLPENFWSTFGGHIMRRAASVYLSSQPFALSFLLLLPAMAYSLVTQPEHRGWFRLTLGVALVALMLTITRTSIVACMFELFLLGLVLRQPRWVVTILLAGTITLLLTFGSFSLSSVVLDTLHLKDPSSLSHIRAWRSSLDFLIDSPLFGHGLASAGQTANRFGGVNSGEESVYLKYTGELGLIGLTFYLGLFLGVLSGAWRVFRHTRRASVAGVAVVVLVGGLGIALNSMTTGLWATPFLTYIFWWLAGLVMQYDTVQPRFRSISVPSPPAVDLPIQGTMARSS